MQNGCLLCHPAADVALYSVLRDVLIVYIIEIESITRTRHRNVFFGFVSSMDAIQILI